LNLYFEPHAFLNCKVASAPHPNLARALNRACYASTTKYHCKTVVWWHNKTVRNCDKTRTLACHIYQTSSFSHYKKGKSLQHFRQEDISHNLAETSLSPWLW